MADVKGVSSHIRAQIARAASEQSPAGTKINKIEARNIRESAAAEVLKKTGWSPTSRDVTPYNKVLNNSGVSGFKGVNDVAFVSDGATRRHELVATTQAAKLVRGLHPVGSPGGYLDTKNAKAGFGNDDRSVIRVPFDMGAYLKEQGVKPGDKALGFKLLEANELAGRSLVNLLPNGVVKKMGQVEITSKPTKGLATYGAEAFRAAFFDPKMIKETAKYATPAERKVLNSVSAEFILAGAQNGKGEIQLPVAPGVIVDKAVGESAMMKLMARNPDLQHFGELNFKFVTIDLSND